MNEAMPGMIYPEESYKIMGACFEVYKLLGSGLPEVAYQQALTIELKLRGIDAQPHPTLDIYYKGTKLDAYVIPDFICYGKIVLELKAEPRIISHHEGQTLCYLQLTGHKLGIIANFGHHPQLEYKRLAH